MNGALHWPICVQHHRREEVILHNQLCNRARRRSNVMKQRAISRAALTLAVRPGLQVALMSHSPAQTEHMLNEKREGAPTNEQSEFEEEAYFAIQLSPNGLKEP